MLGGQKIAGGEHLMDRFSHFRVGHCGVGGRDAGDQARRRSVGSGDQRLAVGSRVLCIGTVVEAGAGPLELPEITLRVEGELVGPEGLAVGEHGVADLLRDLRRRPRVGVRRRRGRRDQGTEHRQCDGNEGGVPPPGIRFGWPWSSPSVVGLSRRCAVPPTLETDHCCAPGPVLDPSHPLWPARTLHSGRNGTRTGRTEATLGPMPRRLPGDAFPHSGEGRGDIPSRHVPPCSTLVVSMQRDRMPVPITCCARNAVGCGVMRSGHSMKTGDNRIHREPPPCERSF